VVVLAQTTSSHGPGSISAAHRSALQTLQAVSPLLQPTSPQSAGWHGAAQPEAEQSAAEPQSCAGPKPVPSALQRRKSAPWHSP
jgi:hypothetical protein